MIALLLLLGVTQTAGGVDIASTTYIIKILLCITLVLVLPGFPFINMHTVLTGYGITANRFLRVDVAPRAKQHF